MGLSVETRAGGSSPRTNGEDYRGLRLTTEPLDTAAGVNDHYSGRNNRPFDGLDWTMLGTSGLWPL